MVLKQTTQNVAQPKAVWDIPRYETSKEKGRRKLQFPSTSKQLFIVLCCASYFIVAFNNPVKKSFSNFGFLLNSIGRSK
jgi:hypothetical protein